METINSNKIKAKAELEKIERRKKSWKSDFIRAREIWKEIAMQINSNEGEKQEFWGLVMDLYKEKYSHLDS